MPIDYKRYPPNWLSEIRPRIMSRANDKCEDCGAPHLAIICRQNNGKWKFISWSTKDAVTDAQICDDLLAIEGIKGVKIVLTIAHLDHDADNWKVTDDRLKALCQRCHLKLDAGLHANNRKYGRNWKRDQTSLDL